MKRLILLCLLLAGCAQRMEPQNEPIALLYSAEEASKTDALAEGDQVTVCASVDGTQNYFLEDSRWTVGPDGKALVPPQPVFYPDAKQAVTFWAYFGTQSVPSDQSTAAALKQADLCWASASSTPSHTAVPLTFSHVFARLVVTCSQPTSRILTPSAFSGGSLDIKTGAFTNSTKSDVFTTQNELIVPAQTLNRLLLTSGGVDYVFDGSIALESGKTTTVNLTLNTSTKTATLNGSSVSAWIASTQSGNLSEAVSNVLTLHWPNFIQQGALPDKVLLTINGSDYTISSGITYAAQTFTVPFASAALRYPYTITKITFYNGSAQSLPACTQLLGATVYKSAAQTLGIKDQAGAIKIGNLWWATGNLVADGPNGCKIGAPTDYGLYFVYGSLVGWSGGANGDGTGQGYPTVAQRVKPLGYSGTSSWPTPYWSGGSSGQNITNVVSDNPATGIGDACRYYLRGSWRLATIAEWGGLLARSDVGVWLPYSAAGLRVMWVSSGQTVGGIAGPGCWVGPGISAGVGVPTRAGNLFFSASGYIETGTRNSVGEGISTYGATRSSTNWAYTVMFWRASGVAPAWDNYAYYACVVRCVSDAP